MTASPGFAAPDAGDGGTGGTAELPVAAGLIGGTADAPPGVVPPVLTGSGAPLFGAEADAEGDGPAFGEDDGMGLPPAANFAPASLAESLGGEALVEDGLGIAFCATAPLPVVPDLAGSAAAGGFAGSGAPGLVTLAESAGFAAPPPGKVAVVPCFGDSAGLDGSVLFGAPSDGRALLPGEPGLAGAEPGVTEGVTGAAGLSPGRSVGLPRSSADDVTGVSSLS